MSLITLLTDFDTRDGYAGIMKGVIHTIYPQAQIVDITHQIPPQNVLHGALVLKRSVPFFPPETIHIAVVDPGVGTSRRPIAARVGQFYVVGPDNGLFTALFRQYQPLEIVHLDRRQYWLPEVSSVFHGRDIFAPAGAYLASGVSLSELGTPITDPVWLDIPTPERGVHSWRGEVIHIDTFGNLGTNLDASHLPAGKVQIRIAGVLIDGISKTFGDKTAGELVALIDSDRQLAVGVVNGSAAARLNAGVGTPVEIFSA